MVKEKIKWNHIKCSVKTREGRRGWGQKWIQQEKSGKMIDIIPSISTGTCSQYEQSKNI